MRITDLNYGGHVGNDSILSLIHEIRMQYLASLGYSVKNLEGTGMIMSDVSIEFKNELFYGDTIIAYVGAGEIGKFSFELYYKMVKEKDGQTVTVANAKTGMVCYDYELKKVVPLPGAAKKAFEF